MTLSIFTPAAWVITILCFFTFLPKDLWSAQIDYQETGTSASPSTEQRENQKAIIKTLHDALEKRERMIESLRQRLEILEGEVRDLKNKGPEVSWPAAGPPSGSQDQIPQIPGSDKIPQKPALTASPSEGPVIQGEKGEKVSLQKTNAPAGTSSPSPASPEIEEEQFVQSALERILIERRGLLLSPGVLEFEPSFSYVHASSDQISIDGFTILPVLVIGEIVSERLRRDILLPAFTFRLGLPRDFQVETRIPFRYESEQTVLADGTERFRHALGLGDVELAVSRQIMREKGWIPDLLGSFRWKTTTGHDPFGLEPDEAPLGTGFNGLQLMLTALKVEDPIALFGNLSYTANLTATKFGDRINPGDTWGTNLGLALALNLETSINFGWEQQFTGRAKVNGEKIPGSNLAVGNFRVGITHNLAQNSSLDLALNIGLTRDAPDVQITVAFPFRLTRLSFEPDEAREPIEK